jgi:hypothetical protein
MHMWTRTYKQKQAYDHMGVSINGDTPQWMVYNGFFFIKMDDLEVFQETTIWTDTVKSYKIYPGKDDATKHRCWLCSCNNQQMYLVERLNQKFWVNTLLYMRRERESTKIGGLTAHRWRCSNSGLYFLCIYPLGGCTSPGSWMCLKYAKKNSSHWKKNVTCDLS